MNVKKQTPSSHCDECFRLTFSPVKSLLCSLPSGSEVLKIFVSFETFGSVFNVNIL